MIAVLGKIAVIVLGIVATAVGICLDLRRIAWS